MSEYRKIGVVNLDEYRNVYVSGDLHGDVYALIKVLLMTGRVQIDDDVVEMAKMCPTDTPGGKIPAFPSISARMQVLPAPGKDLLIFNGDLVDNVRPGNVRNEAEVWWGVCGWKNAEEIILQTISHLHTREESLQVVVCIGNHDFMSMLVSSHRAKEWCAQFSPSKDQLVFDGGKFLCRARRAQMLWRYLNVPGLTCACIDLQHKGNHHFYICHGGLHHDWLRQVEENLYPAAVAEHFTNPYSVELPNDMTLIEKTNFIFWRIIETETMWKRGDSTPLLEAYSMVSDTSPIWCRPYNGDVSSIHGGTTRIEWGLLAANLFEQPQNHHILAMVVAHTVQFLSVCIDSEGWPMVPDSSGNLVEPPDRAICYVDVGMGRSMDIIVPGVNDRVSKPVDERTYALLTVSRSPNGALGMNIQT